MGLAVWGAGGGGLRWGAGTTQGSQTGRWESFQSDGVNGLGLDVGQESIRTGLL